MENSVNPVDFDTRPPAPTKRFALIRADWHADVVDRAREGFLREMATAGIGADQVDDFSVPGAFEIPLLVKKLAQSEQYAGIVAVALVVDGGIYRHDFVAEAVVSGLMRVQLDTDVPVFSVVLTPHNYQETEDLITFYRDHFVKKGAEAARACLRTIDTLGILEAVAG